MSLDRRTFLAGLSTTAMPAASARAALPPYRIPITLTDSRVLVDCMIGEHGPYRLVFDTGGTIGLLELKLARHLKLKELGTSRLGLKQGSKDYPIFAVPNLTFGGQVRQTLSAIAGVDVVNFRDGAVGSIAAGALTSGDCELDFDAREWRIYRDGAPDRQGWTRYDNAIFHQGNVNGSAFIAADATLGRRSFRFGLDTGMPATMHIYRKTAEAAGLWNAPRWSPAAPGGRSRMVRAPLTFGGATIPDAVITVIEEPEWSVFPAGVIGLPILRRFNMATAAKDAALYLKRNALPPQPERYNRAGMWIGRNGSVARVAVVGAGSPAEAAGLKAGDRLIGSDFSTLIDRMFDPAGREIALAVDRAGARSEVRLQPRDFL